MLARLGHGGAALERCRAAVAADGSVGTWGEAGALLVEAGQAAAARHLLAAARRAHPGDGALAVALGQACLDCGDADAARAALTEGLARAPTLLPGLLALSALLLRDGATDRAAALWDRAVAAAAGAAEGEGARLVRAGAVTLASFGATARAQALLARDPAPQEAEHAHLAAALRGEARPDGAPPDYVRSLFDRFAPQYDATLAQIGNRGPELIGAAVAALVAEAQAGEAQAGEAQAGEAGGTLAVLDAGCGTGLCAPVLRPHARWLAGADLSPGMLALARAGGLYDRLAEADLRALPLSALAPPEGGGFDLVVACDVLVYLGDLTAPFAGLGAALRPGGRILATLEAAGGEGAGEAATGGADGYRLQPSGRHAHGAAHVAAALAAAGLRAETLRPVPELRREFGVPVAGLVVVARTAGS